MLQESSSMARKNFPWRDSYPWLRSYRLGNIEGCVGTTSAEDETTPDGRRRSSRSAGLGKRLDPKLKSWLDNVIIPALVREYLVEIKHQNRLATIVPSEVTSDMDGSL
jgi:hypothetical protein